MRTHKSLAEDNVHTAEIIRKVTMTLLINSNKDFDFVDWVIKTPCLFFLFLLWKQFHYVKETQYDVSSLLALVKIVVASQHKGQRKSSLSRFVDNWKHRLKVHLLAMHIVTCTHQTFLCKLAKQEKTIGNYQNRFWLRLTIVWKSHK